MIDTINIHSIYSALLTVSNKPIRQILDAHNSGCHTEEVNEMIMYILFSQKYDEFLISNIINNNIKFLDKHTI